MIPFEWCEPERAKNGPHVATQCQEHEPPCSPLGPPLLDRSGQNSLGISKLPKACSDYLLLLPSQSISANPAPVMFQALGHYFS